MTLVEFIKSHAGEDTSFGNLAEDVMEDKNFPYDQPEERIISYLGFLLSNQNNEDILEELLAAYNSNNDKTIELTDLDTRFAPMKAEQWVFLKANFPCDRVITIGEPGDIYRVYAVDSVGKIAIKFDVYTTRRLTELSMVDVQDIHVGDLTNELSVLEALDALAANHFNGIREPTQPNYNEMISYLRSQKKN